MLFLFIGAALLNAYAAVLVVARALVYRTALYRPMLWNIVLSIAPILILVLGGAAWALTARVDHALSLAVLGIAAAVWLLMLPNASYLITELNLSHRTEHDDRVPLWYDIILVISLAMSGVANTVLNVFIVHTFYAGIWVDDDAAVFVRPGVLAAVGAVMLLLGLGMYLGRYLRLNSWDVKHPVAFARKVLAHFRVAANVWACLGFTLTYAVFLAIIYVLIAGPVVQGLFTLEGALAPYRQG
ncbi:DUF1361 domain-containing protein [Leucobacter sp. CSA1]|uniref:DUF1361 domain-containing protein n=1 Tax=Leucobacter chromiisoli TaxID=2796471 RepID=A0A934Q4K5_9MICO|nr:DUF1361 domain-containing protein [Leucobacter chromiisoli]MBK0417431.1 DUF1361 domain-containing protein [Leucobacter chromiisoli]